MSAPVVAANIQASVHASRIFCSPALTWGAWPTPQVLGLRSDKLLETGLGAGGGVGNMELVTLKGAAARLVPCLAWGLWFQSFALAVAWEGSRLPDTCQGAVLAHTTCPAPYKPDAGGGCADGSCSCCSADAKIVGAEGIDLPPLNAVVTDFVQASCRRPAVADAVDVACSHTREKQVEECSHAP